MAIARCLNRLCRKIKIPQKSISAIRRTVNSKLKCMGMSSLVASSILGHTVKVNENNYSYDVANEEYRKEMFAKMSVQIKAVVMR